jgi:hypothetical protein
MEIEVLKSRESVPAERQCLICGREVATGYWCRICEQRGLNPQQFAEFFWDEA